MAALVLIPSKPHAVRRRVSAGDLSLRLPLRRNAVADLHDHLDPTSLQRLRDLCTACVDSLNVASAVDAAAGKGEETLSVFTSSACGQRRRNAVADLLDALGETACRQLMTRYAAAVTAAASTPDSDTETTPMRQT